MKRVLIFSIAAGAAIAVSAAPAVAGLIGNASFSRQIPVQLPSGATPAQLADDHGGRATLSATTGVPTAQPTRSEVEDRHGAPKTSAEPGDDNGGLGTSGEPEPGDDRSGDDRSGDNRGPGGTPTATATSDDDHRGSPSPSSTGNTSSGRGGGDDSSGVSNRGPGGGSDG